MAEFTSETRLYIDGEFSDARSGGYKQSGVGREMGVEGFSEVLETKAVGLPA